MTTPIIRDHEVTRQFETTREHRMAHIDRLYDFEPDPEPKTVTATDPATGEVLAHFHMDADGTVEDQLEVVAPQHVLTQHLLATPDDVPGVIRFEPDAPTPVAEAHQQLERVEPASAVVQGEDFPDGLTLGGILVFARDLAETNLPVRAKVKAWTTQDGTVTRLAVVAP